MPKALTPEEKRAAFKAKDQDDRRERAALDAETLDALIVKAEEAQAAAAAVEALCGDLVSDVSNHALKAQAAGGPSVALGHILTLARQSRESIGLAMAVSGDA